MIVSTAKLAKPLLPAALRSTGCADRDRHRRRPRRPVRAASTSTTGTTLIAGASGRRRSAVAARATVDARGPRLHHLHQRHRRRAARGDAASRRDPAQCRRLLRRSSRRISAGTTRCSCPSCRSATPTSIPAASILPIGLGAQIYYSEGLEKLAVEHRGGAPDDHGRRAAPVRGAAHADHQGDREAGQARAATCSTARSTIGAQASTRAAAAARPADEPARSTRLFKPKIAKRFGGRIKAMVSGGAPLNPEVGIFFQSLGLTLLQGYGQTEAAPVISCNRPTAGHQDGHGRPAAGRTSRCGSPRTARSWCAASW